MANTSKLASRDTHVVKTPGTLTRLITKTPLKKRRKTTMGQCALLVGNNLFNNIKFTLSFKRRRGEHMHPPIHRLQLGPPDSHCSRSESLNVWLKRGGATDQQLHDLPSQINQARTKYTSQKNTIFQKLNNNKKTKHWSLNLNNYTKKLWDVFILSSAHHRHPAPSCLGPVDRLHLPGGQCRSLAVPRYKKVRPFMRIKEVKKWSKFIYRILFRDNLEFEKVVWPKFVYPSIWDNLGQSDKQIRSSWPQAFLW